MAVDPGLLAQALADLRAIPARPAPEPAPTPAHACHCAGDRAAYQQHMLRKELVCPASREANRLYLREYGRTRRNLHRDELNRRRRERYGATNPRGPRR